MKVLWKLRAFLDSRVNVVLMMKPDAVLINSARGELQNEEDLHKALVQGIISGAALDVFQQEPIAEDSPLRKLENVILTPVSYTHLRAHET